MECRRGGARMVISVPGFIVDINVCGKNNGSRRLHHFNVPVVKGIINVEATFL